LIPKPVALSVLSSAPPNGLVAQSRHLGEFNVVKQSKSCCSERPSWATHRVQMELQLYEVRIPSVELSVATGDENQVRDWRRDPGSTKVSSQ
jgi:hypothetical protein